MKAELIWRWIALRAIVGYLWDALVELITGKNPNRPPEDEEEK